MLNKFHLLRLRRHFAMKSSRDSNKEDEKKWIARRYEERRSLSKQANHHGNEDTAADKIDLLTLLTEKK